MNEIVKFNQSRCEAGITKFQVNFKIDMTRGSMARQKTFNKELSLFISDCYASMRTAQSAKVAPMPRIEFTGLKEGVDAQYHNANVVGFPSSIGVLVFDAGNVRFYKMGILIQSYK
jgi:hypothetical protein